MTKNTLEEIYGRELPEFNGEMLLWRCIVMPMMPPEKTAGGIILSDESLEYSEYMNKVGILVAVGPSCYKHPKYKNLGVKEADFPKRGDWVMFSQHAPMRLEQNGVKLVMLDDDQILAKIKDPKDFKAYSYAGNS